MLLFLVACSGAQGGGGGKAFCESYELNFLGECRQNCEQDVEPDDEAGQERCEDACYAELADDDTFSSDCSDRARELRDRG